MNSRAARLAAGLLLLFAAGCFKTVSDETAMPALPRYTGTAPWGIDGLRPGQTRADAIKLFGEPREERETPSYRFLSWSTRNTMVTVDKEGIITEVYGHSVTAEGRVLISSASEAEATQVLGPGKVQKRSRPKGSGVISLGQEHVGTTLIYDNGGVQFELPVWGEVTGNYWARRLAAKR